jgi:hypothetical protein
MYILGVLDEKANAVNVELQAFLLTTIAAFPKVGVRAPPRPQGP